MYDKIALRDILLDADCRTVNDNGRAYPPASQVYKEVARRMEARGSKIGFKHVHTIVNNNRNGFRDLVIGAFGIKVNEIGEESSHVNQPTDSSNVSDGNSSGSYNKTFNLIISAERWAEMKPRVKVYGEREYLKLKEGWTATFADKIVEQQGISCAFTFENHTVHLSSRAKAYVHFHGLCKECGATINGYLYKQPLRTVDVVFECIFERIVPFSGTHTGRRQVKGERREQMGDDLIDKGQDAVTYRREMAKRVKKFGNKDPPTLPSAAVIRKVKEQQLLKRYGLLFSNAILNLLHSSKFGVYAGSIHSIGVLKFFCIYWTVEQQQIYVERCKRDPDAYLVIDATGGICQRDSPQDPAVFLYQCMLVSKDGSVPVFQMISEDQRAFHIAYFLRFILSKNLPIPRMVVSDFGWALLIAVAEVFAKCADLRDYLQKCYQVVELKKLDALPFTYIRLDVSHLVAMVARWKCLYDKQNRLVRRFYLRCVSLAYQMSSFTDLKCFLESVLVVALCQCVGSLANGQPSIAETRLQYLNGKIKGEVVSDDIANECVIDSDDEDDPEDEHSYAGTSVDEKADWKTWSNNILESARDIASVSDTGSTFNACYNPLFAKRFTTQLISYIPLWTGVMRPFFGRGSVIATSSSVEAEFCDMKHRGFKGKLPMRTDKFVVQHLDHLDGKIKLASKPEDVPALKPKNVLSSKPEDVPALKPKNVLASKPEDVPASKPKNLPASKPKNVPASKPRNVLSSKPEDVQTLDPKDVPSTKSGDRRTTNRKDVLTSGYDSTCVASIDSNIIGDPSSYDHNMENFTHVTTSAEISDKIMKESELNSVRSVENENSANHESLKFGDSSTGIKTAKVETNQKRSKSRKRPLDCSLDQRDHKTVSDVSIRSIENGNSAYHKSQKFEDSSTVNKTVQVQTDGKKTKSKKRSLDCSLDQRGHITVSDESSNVWNTMEPWRGLAESPIAVAPASSTPKKKRPKPSYLDPCPEWDAVKDSKTANIPMFLNGHLVPAPKIDGVFINVVLSCAFDSLLTLITNGISAHSSYSDELASSDSAVINLARSVLAGNIITSKHYEKRATIMMELFMFQDSIKHYKGSKKIVAKCNVGHLTQSLLTDVPSIRTHVSCQCGYKSTTTSPIVSVDVDVLLLRGLQHMQLSIDNARTTSRQCRKCERQICEQTFYGPHIIIDVAIFTDTNYDTRDSKIIHNLDSVAKSLTLGNKRYVLNGVVEYSVMNEHYVAHAYSGMYWHTYDDLRKRRSSGKPQKTLTPHLIYYVLSGTN